MTLSILLLGIVASLVAELVSFVNTKLSGTPFKGQGAWWIAAIASLIAGFVKEYFLRGSVPLSYNDLATYSVAAFGISQIWFGTISTWLGLQAVAKVVAPAAVAAVTSAVPPVVTK
jgi:hypothetical protein